MTLKWIFLTVPRGGKMDFPSRGAYPHNVWDRDGISGAGYFCEGLGGVTKQQKPALLWFYNHYLKELDEKGGTPLDTPSPYPHHSILAMVNWPFGLDERNPIECIPPAVMDKKYGVCMFRNRWQDENDIVVSVQTQNTRGWHKANTDGGVVVWTFGRKMKWGRMKTKVVDFQAAADGSGIVTGADGTCLAVDFSKASGADGMLVMTGPGAPGGDTVKLGDTTLSFLFLTGGKKPEPKAEGDHVVAGRQTVSIKDGKIILDKIAEPWKPR
jgi:hypothetical protein